MVVVIVILATVWLPLLITTVEIVKTAEATAIMAPLHPRLCHRPRRHRCAVPVNNIIRISIIISLSSINKQIVFLRPICR
uniref:Putative secreted protein n=1 Tax=Anopheles darlingi TaxID=43151 RepID=A0A2M4D058_ANODA